MWSGRFVVRTEAVAGLTRPTAAVVAAHGGHDEGDPARIP